jgi:LPS sulfotransferase NodH
MGKALSLLRRPAAKIWRERIRPWTRNFDGKPDFLIIGAQKAGTTWLSYLLTQQAALAKPKIKEVHYFNRHYDLGERWYRSNFPTSVDVALKARQTGQGRVLRYEATPDYLFHATAPERIAADLPGIKLVALVRDPVSRAVSAYNHMARHGLEARSLEDAILNEEAHLEAARRTSTTAYDHALVHHSYVARGRYFDQVERFLRRFPAGDLKVFVYEDLVADPESGLLQLSDFLGVPLPLPERTAPQNTGRYDPRIDPGVERHIRDETEGSSAALFAMLGQPRRW